MIDKQSPIPIYHQLEEQIKKKIESGEYSPGDSIPSEREYAEELGISRMTVRQAITNLVNEQYLHRIKGKGTFIAEQKLEQKLTGLTSFTEDMLARGMTPSNKLIHFEIIPAKESLAKELDIREHSPIYEITRVRLAENVPMALEKTYISANLIKGLTEKIVQASLYQYIEEELDLKIGKASQVIEASLANKEEIELLDIDKHSPILLMKRITHLEDGNPFEIVKSSYRADRYKFMIDLER
ncbi:GntR family transcriptional regulator [Gracilibacillus halotolerans]|uniref:GntR family transcriptional regulator n=1 Tax=Gracilibacillus halotolerans TaxID=74386 RepID=A0A841RRL3_9BACI|nr:GntR family transcriptional regulator [Gracilibacillus halotolerans]MBB6513855.1 GntR family transcriptional regulator [Gracilibacillus halotolerans]